MPYKNIEDRLENQKQYYYKNRESILEKQKEYDRARRDKNRRREVCREYYYRNKEKILSYRKEKVLLQQKFGECEICNRNCRLVYDHDHSTNAFRGWICMQCNVALGMVKDNKETLCKMITYLQERMMV